MVLISVSVLMLLAYLFDLTASKTRIPSVILLLFSGWGVRQIMEQFNAGIPDLAPVLPLLGTVGLILIVFEGSLELQIEKGKLNLIGKSFLAALVPMLILTALIAGALVIAGNPWHASLANAVPLCIISSAIAIPAVRYLSAANREFVVYESCISDIFGVTLFNLFAYNNHISGHAIFEFTWQLLAMALVSLLAAVLLAFLLGRIDHKIKFTPILFMVILIYALFKHYHFPALLFIMVFGLFLGNLDQLKTLSWMQKLRVHVLEREVKRLHDLVIEATFVIRASFFLLFGFLLTSDEIFNPAALPWSVGILVLLILVRYLQVRLLKIPVLPLLFIAPRGLITVLLFLSLPAHLLVPQITGSVIIQIVLLSSLFMMAGILLGEPANTSAQVPNPEEVPPSPGD